MNSIDCKCTPLKKRYDDCFNAWFKDSFLSGKDDHDSVCGKVYEEYRKCVQVALKSKNINLPDLQKDALKLEQTRDAPS